MRTHAPFDETQGPEVTREHAGAIIAVMRRSHELDVSGYSESFVTRSAEKRRRAAAGETRAAYLERLAEDREEAEAFRRSLHVVYSEFFRDPLVFALLEQRILPGLVDVTERSGRGELRIWSAGCAAGQEAWSVAILLDDMAAARGKPISCRIFATDLSEPDLTLARSGVYPAAALGNVRLGQLDRCFSRTDGAYVLAARFRGRVDFSVYDLLDAGTACPPACIYGAFDLVLCSNVLLYYGAPAQRRIVDKLRRGVTPGGYLMTGETERSMVKGAGGFREVAPPVAVFQRTSEEKGG